MSVSGSKLKRIAIYTGLSLLLLLLGLVALVSTFLATETGSRSLVNFAVGQLDNSAEMTVEIDAIRGNLLQGLQLEQVYFDNPAVDVRVENVVASWNPGSLFSGRLLLNELTLDSPVVTVKASQQESVPEPGPGLDEFSFAPLPVDIALRSLTVNELVINSGEQQFVVNSLSSGIRLIDTRLTLNDLNVTGMDLAADGNIALELGPNLPLQADLSWRYRGSLPLAYDSAGGELTLSGDLQSLTVDHQLRTPFILTSSGQLANVVDPDTLRVDFTHRADQIQIPLEAMPLSVLDFQLVTSGTLDNLELALQSGVQSESLPAVSIDTLATLSGSTLAIQNLALTTDTGALTLDGALDWQQGLVAQGAFNLQEPQPLRYVDLELPVSVADVLASGSFQIDLNEAGESYRLALQNLDARLDDYQLAANGDLGWIDNQLQIDELHVQTDDNELLVNGNYADELDLRWQLNAPRLQQFVPGYSGNVTGSGVVRGEPLNPVIDASLTVQGLSSDTINLASAELAVNGDGEHYELEINLSDAAMQGSSLPRIDSARLTASGNENAHQLNVRVDSGSGAFDLALTGSFTDLESLDWQGELQRANLDGVAGQWSNTEPVSLAWLDSQLRVSNGCWTHDMTRLCLAVEPAANQAYELSGTLNDFPLTEFNANPENGHLLSISQIPRLPAEVSLAGLFSADLTASFGPEIDPAFSFTGAAQDTSVSIRTLVADDFGAVTSEAEEIEETYDWEELQVAGELRNGNWQLQASAILDSRIVEDSAVELDGNLQLDASMAADGSLSGGLTANFQDLGWVSALVPDLSAVEGNLSGEIDLTGTMDTPDIRGQIELNEGSFFLERSGVTYSDLEFLLESESIREASLQGSVTAGEGTLTYSGEANALTTPDWRITAALQSENFLIASLPELVLAVSPDLNLNINSEQIELTGELHVPVLGLVLRELPESAVDISRDVVIVDYPEERPELGRSFTTGQTSLFDLPLVLDVELSLGEDVSFTGFGLTAELAGNLSIEQFSNGRNLTYGDLQITDGNYTLYGQTLTLREGELLFLGNYNNPTLDVRAVREVEDMEVGVHMTGTARNLRSELFSSPVLPESDILSVLVTGRPVSELRSGEGADVMGAITSLGLRRGSVIGEQIGTRLGLDTVAITNSGDVDSSVLTLGKYLSPDLFIRYGIGLFDNQSKVALDYSITEQLTLQAESGESQSLDLTYKVER